MDRLPDALFVVDTGYEKIAIAEARKLGIPIIAVVDSNMRCVRSSFTLMQLLSL